MMMLDKEQIEDLKKLVKLGKAIYLRENLPSKKNEHEIRAIKTKKSECCNVSMKKLGKKYYCSKCGKETKHKLKRFIGSSNLVLDYNKKTKAEYLKAKVLFKRLVKDLPEPYYIGWFLIRKHRHNFDYTNTIESSQDLFTKYNFWEDDNMKINVPVFLGYGFSKKNAGVIVLPLIKKPYIDLKIHFKK